MPAVRLVPATLKLVGEGEALGKMVLTAARVPDAEITGVGFVGGVTSPEPPDTATLSSVLSAKVSTLWLQTAKPTVADAAMLIVWLVSICVQTAPSAE